MAVYEYLCPVCDARFEARRPMSEAASPITCPSGHGDTTRLPSVFATVGGGASRQESSPSPVAAGGCGPGCACAHG
jgi:putative FmdB family regulatory protein